MKTVDLIYVTCNRLFYTERTLPELFYNTAYPFNLTIVDNGSKDGTVEFLKQFEDKPNVKIIYNKENEGLSKPTNAFWKNSKADYVGKVDNDVIIPYGWLKRLVDVYESTKSKNIKVGALGGCAEFPKGLFEHLNLTNVDQTALEHYIYYRQFIGGCTYIIDKKIIEKNGYLEQEKTKVFGWSQYQAKLSKKGYHSAYVYPLMMVEHMGSPDSCFFEKTEANLQHLKIVLKDRSLNMKKWLASKNISENDFK